MVGVYCRSKHGTKNSLCNECQSLHSYAQNQLAQCPFGHKKPICSKCSIHCYTHDKREQIKKVMRFTGPVMIWQHPFLALDHLVRGMFQKQKRDK